MTDQKSTYETAIADANRHWAEGQAKVLCLGDILSRVPVLDESGLYIAVSFDAEYVRHYNDQVHRLLACFGLPSWSPGCRLPDSESALSALTHGQRLIEIQFQSIKERRLVNSQIRRFTEDNGVEPERFVRIPGESLLLLGGNTGDGYVIDVVDLLYYVWMARFRFPITQDRAAQ